MSVAIDSPANSTVQLGANHSLLQSVQVFVYVSNSTSNASELPRESAIPELTLTLTLCFPELGASSCVPPIVWSGNLSQSGWVSVPAPPNTGLTAGPVSVAVRAECLGMFLCQVGGHGSKAAPRLALRISGLLGSPLAPWWAQAAGLIDQSNIPVSAQDALVNACFQRFLAGTSGFLSRVDVLVRSSVVEPVLEFSLFNGTSLLHRWTSGPVRVTPDNAGNGTSLTPFQWINARLTDAVWLANDTAYVLGIVNLARDSSFVKLGTTKDDAYQRGQLYTEAMTPVIDQDLAFITYVNSDPQPKNYSVLWPSQPDVSAAGNSSSLGVWTLDSAQRVVARSFRQVGVKIILICSLVVALHLFVSPCLFFLF